MNVKPLGDRVLIQAHRARGETVKGGIIIPDSAKEKPMEGKVVAVGQGKYDENGKRDSPWRSRRVTGCSSGSTPVRSSSSTKTTTSSCARTRSSASLG